MRQTIALIVDAYRELNHKRLFWITMILSAVLVLSFLGVKIDDAGLIIFGMRWRMGINALNYEPALFYRLLFIIVGVNIWLAMAAAPLALISTAGIFPDLLTGGSIDLYLSKPISRLRLFLSKYFTGLLFVALQVAAFSAVSFIVLAIRGHIWVWGVFLAVPILLLFYSYLYCVCVLLGVLTRSTIAAILFTCLLWFVIFGVHWTETETLRNHIKDGYVRPRLEPKIVREQEELAAAENTESPGLRESRVIFRQKKIAVLRQRLQENTATLASESKWHGRFYFLATLLPKTTETVDLMKRWMTSASRPHGESPEYEGVLSENEPMPLKFGLNTDDLRAGYDLDKVLRARPLSWVLGTSIAFEAVIVSIAAWIFCRRDY